MRSFKEQISYFNELSSGLGVRQAALFRAAQLLRVPQVTITLDPQTSLAVRPRTTDLRVAQACFAGEFEDLATYCDTSFEGLIIDAGGYIGTAALCLARLFPKATIATIEPSSANFKILSQNIAQEPRIHAIQAALSAKSGDKLRLMDRKTGNWGFSIIETAANDQEPSFIEEVETICVPDIAARFPDKALGILKLDIEGAEKALFETAPEQFRDIPVIFAELHDFFIPGCEAAFHSFAPDRRVENFGGEKFLSLTAANPQETVALRG